MFVILVISMCLNKGRDNQTVKSNTHNFRSCGYWKDSTLFFLTTLASLEPQLLHSVLKRGPLHSKPGCGPVRSSNYPIHLFQRSQNMLSFRSLKRLDIAADDCMSRLQFRNRDLERRSLRQNHRSFDKVFELAHVPRPVIPVERRHRFRRYTFNLLLQTNRIFLSEESCEWRNIFRSVAQRRNRNRKYIQSVIKITAIGLTRNHLFQVAVCRCNQPDVDL